MLRRLSVLLVSLLVVDVGVRRAMLADNTAQRDSSAEKLFRQKCLRCHDLRMATRPVHPEAADSLVRAMRRYDSRWIKAEDIPVLVDYVREYHARRNSLIHSHSIRSTP